MPTPIKIITCAGARPNFMKVAPLLRAMKEHTQITSVLVHTGQHYDPNLSEVFFRELEIPAPNYNLEIGSMPREEQISKIESAFEPVVIKEQPQVVIVVGDVNSTVACARIGKKHGTKVVHVEAGLRSFDATMPEEHNRIETDRLSDLLFVTEQSGIDNLKREGIAGEAILAGNVMIDTLEHSLAGIIQSNIISTLSLNPKSYITATFHRPSNVDDKENLTGLLQTLRLISELAQVVLPLHPRTRAAFERHGLRGEMEKLERVALCDPLGYFDFMRLVKDSLAVVTDSGGVQEESTYLGVPCLTMRLNTERPITVDIGSNILIGGDTTRLVAELKKIVSGSFKSSSCPPLWDGAAAERIIRAIVERLDP